ncbi:hypothetical protein KUV65_07055 [Maritalea mobilis]|uniref:hypothetical protein n=1 Tax=Maritalea mobilis TaxID=483324 RepID=UPI001C946AF3|nr:hypothetical protein [Maritalea mobilis]MBY6201110.1 hypothetical protein [Maritalea mobilis]
MSLFLDTPLPPGALCDDTAGVLAPAFADTRTLWWHGAEADMATDKTGAVTHWHPRSGEITMRPTKPNEGNGTLGFAGDLTGLQCRHGAQSGLFADRAIPGDAATATIAIRWYVAEGDDARTLFTLNTAVHAAEEGGGNYLFLSADASTLTAKDDANTVETSLPLPTSDAPRMAIVSLHAGRMALQLLGADRVEARSPTPILTGPASLFLGCRNQRPRLVKTLGGALILDAWLWPGRALLHSDTDEDRALLTALHRYRLWSEDAA